MAGRPKLSFKLLLNAWYGMSFGVAVGILMRMPGVDAVVPAFAINLCVMAALWLGIAIGDPQEKKRAYSDIFAAALTFVLAAIALRTYSEILAVGFLFQVWWSLQHRSDGLGVIGPVWFLLFASMANLSFGIVLLVLLRWFS